MLEATRLLGRPAASKRSQPDGNPSPRRPCWPAQGNLPAWHRCKVQKSGQTKHHTHNDQFSFLKEASINLHISQFGSPIPSRFGAAKRKCKIGQEKLGEPDGWLVSWIAGASLAHCRRRSRRGIEVCITSSRRAHPDRGAGVDEPSCSGQSPRSAFPRV